MFFIGTSAHILPSLLMLVLSIFMVGVDIKLDCFVPNTIIAEVSVVDTPSIYVAQNRISAEVMEEPMGQSFYRLHAPRKIYQEPPVPRLSHGYHLSHTLRGPPFCV